MAVAVVTMVSMVVGVDGVGHVGVKCSAWGSRMAGMRDVDEKARYVSQICGTWTCTNRDSEIFNESSMRARSILIQGGISMPVGKLRLDARRSLNRVISRTVLVEETALVDKWPTARFSST